MASGSQDEGNRTLTIFFLIELRNLQSSEKQNIKNGRTRGHRPTQLVFDEFCDFVNFCASKILKARIIV